MLSILLREYQNVIVYSEPTEVLDLDKLKVLFIPWINAENFEDTVNAIKVFNVDTTILNIFQCDGAP